MNDAKLETSKIVCGILGYDPEALPPFSERPAQMQLQMSKWYARLDVVAHLQRVGFPMTFAAAEGGAGVGAGQQGGEPSATKRQRV